MYQTFILYIWLIPLQEEVSLETLLLVLINSRWLSHSHTWGIFLSQDKLFSFLFSCLLSCDYSEFISQCSKWMLHLAVKFFALDRIMTSNCHDIKLVLLSHAVLDDIPSLAVFMVLYQLAQLALPAGCMLNILRPLLHHKHFWLLTDLVHFQQFSWSFISSSLARSSPHSCTWSFSRSTAYLQATLKNYPSRARASCSIASKDSPLLLNGFLLFLFLYIWSFHMFSIWLGKRELRPLSPDKMIFDIGKYCLGALSEEAV